MSARRHPADKELTVIVLGLRMLLVTLQEALLMLTFL